MSPSSKSRLYTLREYDVFQILFVICPILYDEKEKSDIAKYDKAEIYANQSSINTLEELRFKKWKS